MTTNIKISAEFYICVKADNDFLGFREITIWLTKEELREPPLLATSEG